MKLHCSIVCILSVSLSLSVQLLTMSIPLYIVDAFTTGNNDSFTGNPAAVCLLEYDVRDNYLNVEFCILYKNTSANNLILPQDDIPDAEKQKIAMEMNLSETAFVSEGWARGNP